MHTHSSFVLLKLKISGLFHEDSQPAENIKMQMKCPVLSTAGYLEGVWTRIKAFEHEVNGKH